ncbi:MAG: NADH-quinone oxidoreductase subunit L, partial [bacterium]|nr:NADH-quinone oxidoreductase subunit L [bacterium]
MKALDLIWLIVLLPFAGAALNGVLGPRISKKATTAVALGAPGLSAVLAILAIIEYLGGAAPEPVSQVLYAWTAGPLQIDVAFLLDPLSSVMMFVVTFVGFWIHVYSVGYMGHESGYQRYFVYMNLFMG